MKTITPRRAAWTVTFLMLAALQPELAAAQDEIRDLVVKIHATQRSPDLLKPWTKLNPANVSGSGVVIEGKRILTNAHVVRDASQIYVQPNQSAEKLTARVVAIAPSIDLAILRLEDESFFNNRGFLTVGEELPKVKDTVNVYGFPTGGSELSVTEGIVSRIEFTNYHQFAMGLRVQVDAALNPGNSGGPAVSKGKLVGLVFSNIPSAQNIGYLIPVEEIRLFLDDVADGRYDGKPQMYDSFQTVENNALRQQLGLSKEVGGLMVVEPYRGDGNYPLKEWDVVTRIGGQAIDSDGKVAVRYDLRLSAFYLVQRYTKNGLLPLTVQRNGQAMEIALPVERRRDLVVPYMEERVPRYFIYGPFVFCAATQDYMERLGNPGELSLTRTGNPLAIRRYDKPAFPGEELVVICAPMFPHAATKGYDDPNGSVVQEVNGVRVRNLKHFVEILRDSKEPRVTFKFARMISRGREHLVFDRAQLQAATEDILKDFGIRYPYSDDLRPVWEATPGR
jgi:S1-C subfamily serine protease